MRTGLRVMGVVLVLSACGARTDDNHTGGKTSWLSGCKKDADCNSLEDAVCASRLCTTTCESSCSVSGTTCVFIATSDAVDDVASQACLPECERDADCERFGDNYGCEVGVCALDSLQVRASESSPVASDEDASVGTTGESSEDDVATTDPADEASSTNATPPPNPAPPPPNLDVPPAIPSAPSEIPIEGGDASTPSNAVRDLSGIVLLDTGEDGDNVGLPDWDSPVGFDSYGFWYTYDDIGYCWGDEDPSPDIEATLYPAKGGLFTTTPYTSLGIQPPPEDLPNAPDNTYGIRISGGGHEYFGAGLGYKFEMAFGSGNQGLDFETAGYTGIRFWAYSPIQSSFLVKLEDAYSTAEAGLCVPRGAFPECEGPENCTNAPTLPNQPIELGPQWQLYEVYFAAVQDDPATSTVERGPLARSNWAGVDVQQNEIKTIPPTPDRIFQIKFQTWGAEGETGVFDFIIDNVGFIEANGPEDNANGQFVTPAE